MLGAAPLIDVIPLPLPDRAGPYRFRPEALAEPGVVLVRLLHNGVAQPRGRKAPGGGPDAGWPYRVTGDGEIVWSCYDWLAPRTHKVKIEVDRTVQAATRLAEWLRAHPGDPADGDPLAAAAAACDDPWSRRLAADPGLAAGIALVRLLLRP